MYLNPSGPCHTVFVTKYDQDLNLKGLHKAFLMLRTSHFLQYGAGFKHRCLYLIVWIEYALNPISRHDPSALCCHTNMFFFSPSV